MADKVHRRPVAPGGFTQAPLTSTAVWRGITNSLGRDPRALGQGERQH